MPPIPKVKIHEPSQPSLIIIKSCNASSATLMMFFSNSGCGGFIHTDRGVLSSPQYPQNYKPNLNCVWQIMVTPGFRVSVNFENPFQVQGYGTQCSSGDYIEVREYWGRCDIESIICKVSFCV